MTSVVTSLLCLGLMTSASEGFSVSLTNPSTLFIPYAYNGSEPLFSMAEKVVEQIAYDAREKILYLVGGFVVNVLNISDPQAMNILHHFNINNVKLTDIALCGNHVFIAYDNITHREFGKVLVFEKYKRTEKKMELIQEITVGTLPDMIHPTYDCSSLIVALEGEGYISEGAIVDPPGGIGVISFPHGIGKDNMFNYTKMDFSKFNSRIDELEKTGVRFVYRENRNSFANDVEPEFITMNKHSTTAYISLQENNAIAEVDLTNMNITAVHGLGFKKWKNFKMDASDKDGGINMAHWPIYGMFLPDAIKFMTWKGVDYIMTANEGDSKEYDKLWTEEIRGYDFKDSMFSSAVGEDLRRALKNKTQLGRLVFTKATGRNSNGTFDSLYTFGCRSFSILKADTMEMVYDSGDDIERRLAEHKPAIFNSNGRKLTKTPLQTMDSRSDAKGPEPESLDYGIIDDHLLLFIGNERPGFVTVYSVADNITQPRFEFLFEDIGDIKTTWQELYNQRNLSSIDPEELRFVDGHSSPTGKPILIIAGVTSSTVTIVNVQVTYPTCKGANTDGMSILTLLSVAMLCCMVDGV